MKRTFSTTRSTTTSIASQCWMTVSQRPAFYQAVLVMIVMVAACLSGPADLARADYTGVPHWTVTYGVDVETWWADHPFNVDASSYDPGPITSPTPTVNVADVWAANPSSGTAGIQEAIDSLPSGGGTLWFPKSGGPYVVTDTVGDPPDPGHPVCKDYTNYYTFGAPITVFRRGNIHFLSDGATILWQNSKPVVDSGIIAFSSMEYLDNGGAGMTDYSVARNFYFNGLTFDGNNNACGGLIFRHADDVIIDNCRFLNFTPAWALHPGVLHFTTMTDNVWVRDTEVNGGQWSSYMDGVHAGGFLNCSFTGSISHGALVSMTNDDMSPYDSDERTTQYLVFQDCFYNSDSYKFAYISGAHTLIKRNTINGHMGYMFVEMGGYPSDILHNPQVYFDHINHVIRDNNLQQVNSSAVFLDMWQGCNAYGCTNIGQYKIIDNNMGSCPTPFYNHTGTIMTPNTITGNCIGPECLPDDTTPPSVPQNVTIIEGSCQQVVLTWDTCTDDTGVDGYNVYRDGSGPIATVGSNSYTDINVALCTDYDYTVTAVDAAANESIPSDPATGGTIGSIQPADLSRDGWVDWVDMSMMLNQWLATDPACVIGDLDNSLDVDLGDFELMIAAWTGPMPNIVENPSFADGLTIWGNPAGSAAANGSLDTTFGRTDSASFKAVGGTGDAYLDQTPVLSASTSYDLRCWIKLDNVTGGGARCRYVEFNPDTQIYYGTRLDGTADWQQSTVGFTTTSTYASGRVDLVWDHDTGTAWFDDVLLIEN